MNTKGVEDGITARVWIDPRTEEPCRRCDGTGKMPPWPGSKGLVACGVCRETQTAAVPVASLDELLLNVRSATPEELTAQAESYGRNYKPGPRQATPFMPTALVESPEELPPMTIEPLSLAQITPEIKLLASRCIISEGEAGGGFSKDAHKYAAYTIIRERQLKQCMGWAKRWHQVVEVALTVRGLSPALSAEEAIVALTSPSAAVPVEERTGWIEIREGCRLPEYYDTVTMINRTSLGGPYQEICEWNLAGDWLEAKNAGVTHWKPIEWPASLEPAQPTAVPERTAEMEQLMGRLRELAGRALIYREITPAGHVRGVQDAAALEDFELEASPENILKLLDHIEGKATHDH